MKLTKQQLKLMLPYAKEYNIDKYLEPINDTLALFEINTPKRVAAFIAQLAHESGSFRYHEEIADGHAYEGRKDLGNIVKGDGKKFKGRGLIQLTGRTNYESFGKYVGVDFLSTPSLVAQPKYSALAAGWYWAGRRLNEYADRDDFKGITKRINGGYNGLADRIKHWQRCKAILNVK
jgi:putative chitinase